MSLLLRENRTGGAVFLAVASLRCVAAHGGVKGDLELLRAIVKGHQANFERIRTWRGSASVRHFMSRGPDYRVWETHAVTFAYCQQASARRWNWRRLSVRRQKDGQKEHLPEAVRNIMVKGDSWYQYHDHDLSKEGPNPLSILSANRMTPNNMSIDFDPVGFFRPAGEVLHTRVMFFVENATSPKLETEVTRQGDLVTLEDRLRGVVNRYVFDLSKGCNVVAYHGGSCDSASDWRYEFGLVGGAYVPTSLEIEIRNKTNEGETRVIGRETVFSENVVNVPLDPDEFSLASLGLRTGDRVKDVRLGLRYTYAGERELGRPVGAVGAPAADDGPVAQAPAAGSARIDRSHRPGSVVLAALGAAVVIVIAAARFLVHRRKSRGLVSASEQAQEGD